MSRREEFPLLVKHPNIVYLDSAATSQKPQVVLDALVHAYETYNANVHRGLYPLSIQASKKVEESRETIASFFHTTANNIIFTKNTTESINLLSHSINITNEQNIVTTEIEHHSNFVPWQELAKRSGAQLRIAKYDKEHHTIQSLAELVDEHTKIVSFSGMSNVSGQIFDVKQVVRDIRAKNKNVIIILDACQLAVYEDINPGELDVDFLTCSLHKMYGPYGVGVLYAKSTENLDPFLFGGDMIKNVDVKGATYQEGPQRFEAGTLDIAGIIASETAIKYLSKHREEKKELEQELTSLAVEKLRAIEGMKVIGYTGEHARAIISFYHEVVPSFDIAQFCANENICIRVGQHCAEPFLSALGVHATCRISIGIYTTKEDIQKAVDCIARTVSLISKQKV